MCINVDANGCLDHTDTYVSVFACLMKGRNDDNLPWPFTGEVTVTLLNQLEDENHHSDTVTFPEDSDEANERMMRGLKDIYMDGMNSSPMMNLILMQKTIANIWMTIASSFKLK